MEVGSNAKEVSKTFWKVLFYLRFFNSASSSKCPAMQVPFKFNFKEYVKKAIRKKFGHIMYTKWKIKNTVQHIKHCVISMCKVLIPTLAGGIIYSIFDTV